jgi:hypothetical protein
VASVTRVCEFSPVVGGEHTHNLQIASATHCSLCASLKFHAARSNVAPAVALARAHTAAWRVPHDSRLRRVAFAFDFTHSANLFCQPLTDYI